jgi:hypothetical protein
LEKALDTAQIRRPEARAAAPGLRFAGSKREVESYEIFILRFFTWGCGLRPSPQAITLRSVGALERRQAYGNDVRFYCATIS